MKSHYYLAATALLVPGLLLLAAVPPGQAAAKRKSSSHPAAQSAAAPVMRAPQNPVDHNNLGYQYGMKGNWDMAVKEHEAALNGDPYNPSFKMNLSAALLRYGKALAAKHDYYGAIKKLRYALYVDPNNLEADDVLSGCIKGIGRDPNDPKVRRNFADEADVNGNYIEAIAEYRKYAHMDDSGPAHAALAKVLMKQGSSVPARLVEGFAEMKVAFTKDWKKDANEQRELAACHALMGDTLKDLAFKARDDGRTDPALKRMQSAAIEYRRAAVLNPGNGDAYRGLIEVAREAVAIAPRSFDNHMMLGCAYQLAGDFEHAKREYEECWKIDRNNSSLAQARKSFHLQVLTSPLATLPMKAASVQKVEEMLRTNPNDAELLYVYGRGKEALGDKDVAMQAYQYAMKINPYIYPDLQARANGTLSSGTVAAAPVAGVTYPAAAASAAAPPGQAPAVAAAPPGSPLAGGPPRGLFENHAAQPAAPSPQAQNAAALQAAQSKLSSGDVDGAQKDLLALVDKNPQDGQTWYLLGTTQEKKGDMEEAAVAYRQADYLNNADAGVALRRVQEERAKPLEDEANKALQQNNLPAAINSIKDAIGVAPKLSRLHRQLANILAKMGDQKEADREVQRADELDRGTIAKPADTIDKVYQPPADVPAPKKTPPDAKAEK